MPIEGKPVKVILAANALLRILQMGKTPQQPPIGGFSKRDIGRIFTVLFGPTIGSFYGPPPGTFAINARNDRVVERTIAAVSPILYGLVHFLAWNDHFPSPLEGRIWCVSSVVVTCSGPVGVSWFRCLLGDLVKFITAYLLPVVHVLASGFLLIESFRQLSLGIAGEAF